MESKNHTNKKKDRKIKTKAPKEGRTGRQRKTDEQSERKRPNQRPIYRETKTERERKQLERPRGTKRNSNRLNTL